MFPYEFKQKRVESVSQTKWWLAAGLCGLFITTCFIAITLWLGMNNSANYTLPTYNFNKIPIPSTTSPPPPLPDIYPSAEILRTNIKSKKGRIEMVHEEKIVETTDPTMNEEIHESTEVEIEDYLEEPSVVSSSQSNYVHSSLPTYSSTQATSRNTFETTNSNAKQTSLAESVPDTQGDSSVTRKKSQALYPAWSEPDVAEQMNEYQFQPSRRVYDNPFETKTTPSFSYTTENVRNRDIPVRDQTLNRVRPVEDPYIMNMHPVVPHLNPLRSDSFQSGVSLPRDPLMYRKDQMMLNREQDILHVNNDIKNENDLYYVTTKTPTANPMMSFLQKRIQDIHDWITVSGDSKVKNSDWLEVINSINQSLTEKNSTIILNKIKEMYLNSSELPMASLIYPTVNGSSPITNTPSLISFGLLAIDLFLLHNVQQIAWNEESSIKKEMLSDPDVIAMNALFMPPEKVILLRQANSRGLKDDPASENKGFLHELVEFVNGGLRAAVNLGKAFRSSTNTNGMGRSTSSSALDCIWTLYCRNLDKTARLHGPYGFLAKMNSLGLRLMMGEFPVEKALEHLVTESSKGWKHLNCDTLFPRCGAEEAKQVVLETALGQKASVNS